MDSTNILSNPSQNGDDCHWGMAPADNVKPESFEDIFDESNEPFIATKGLDSDQSGFHNRDQRLERGWESIREHISGLESELSALRESALPIVGPVFLKRYALLQRLDNSIIFHQTMHFRIDEDPVWIKVGSKEFAEKYLQHEILTVVEMAKCVFKIWTARQTLHAEENQLSLQILKSQPSDIHQLVDSIRIEIADISKRVDDVHSANVPGVRPSHTEISGRRQVSLFFCFRIP